MNKLILLATAMIVAAPAIAQTPPPPPPARAPMGQMGQMGDRIQTRAEVITRTQRAFAMLDTNHDNVLDAAELAAAGKAWDGAGAGPAASTPRMPMDRNAMFDMIDSNHDGMISRDEFARAPMNHGAEGMGGRMAGMGGGKGRGMGGGMARLWAMADVNHDGRVTLQEATDMALQRFDRMDLNHDGQVTPEERAAARGQ